MKTTNKSKAAEPGTARHNTEGSTGRKANDSMLLEFLCDEIRDIYWAENQLVKALPKMQEAAASPELQQAFASHLTQTVEHVARLEQVFALLDKKPQAKKCEAMAGITKEGEGIIEETIKGTAARDVGLILAGRKAEQYEISTYSGLAQLARALGKTEVAAILEKTLAEEEETDSLLSGIAEKNVRYTADAGTDS